MPGHSLRTVLLGGTGMATVNPNIEVLMPAVTRDIYAEEDHRRWELGEQRRKAAIARMALKPHYLQFARRFG